MSGCRKDNRGRKLRPGESQRKDGRYVYKYSDALGQTHYAYSRRLLKSDPTPSGKKDGPSLREIEQQIQENLQAGLLGNSARMTVCELVDRYLAQKQGVRENTEAYYRFITGILHKEVFGKLTIDKVRISDAKLWLIKFQKDGRGYSTIHAIRGVLRPAVRVRKTPKISDTFLTTRVWKKFSDDFKNNSISVVLPILLATIGADFQ